MENSTYNRDYLANNFEHNMVHYNHNSCFWRSPSTIAQPRSSTTSSTRESGSTMTFEFSSSSTSRSLCPTTPHLVISLFTPRSSEGGDNDKMDNNNNRDAQHQCTTTSVAMKHGQFQSKQFIDDIDDKHLTTSS